MPITSKSSHIFALWHHLFRFKCIDLDGNGILTHIELQFFFEEQLHRMECMAQEPVLFEDILCQLIDMIGPEVAFITFVHCQVINVLCWVSYALILFQNDKYLTLKDFRRCKLSGHFFNILFNLNKFMAFEARDPFLIRQVSRIAIHVITSIDNLTWTVFHL